jgi:hypothetical protein
MCRIALPKTSGCFSAALRIELDLKLSLSFALGSLHNFGGIALCQPGRLQFGIH